MPTDRAPQHLVTARSTDAEITTSVLAAVDALRSESLDLLDRLVAIPSIGGSEAEGEIQHVLAGVLHEDGFDVDLWQLDLDELCAPTAATCDCSRRRCPWCGTAPVTPAARTLPTSMSLWRTSMPRRGHSPSSTSSTAASSEPAARAYPRWAVERADGAQRAAATVPP